MKMTRKQLVAGLGFFVVMGIVTTTSVLGLGVWWFVSEMNRESAMKSTLVWGRLAALPATANEVKVKTEGGMFTRAFRTSFTASAGDIEKWLKDSPGTRDTTAEAVPPGIRHFEINPGGGAMHAEVEVDDASHRVTIYVYWS